MPLGRNGEPSLEERQEMQRERERERQGEQLASKAAQRAAMDEGTAKEGYWDVLTGPDIASGIEEFDQHLEEFLSVELSGQQTMGNISRKDWLSWGWRIENESWVAQNEFKDKDSKLDSIDMATMGYEDKARFTDKMARRLRGTQTIRKLMLSNSIDARGQRSGTEIHAVARTESEDDDEDEGGRVRNWLSG